MPPSSRHRDYLMSTYDSAQHGAIMSLLKRGRAAKPGRPDHLFHERAWFMTEMPEVHDAVVETELWIDEIVQRLGWQDRHKAYVAFVGALHAIRDALPLEEAVNLAGQMPALLRGLYYEGWHPSLRIPVSRNSFLERIHDAVHRDPGIDTERVAHVVFELLASRLPSAEVEEARASTPGPLRSLWPG
jgi:uncharacterized protein (DUF2267 family)